MSRFTRFAAVQILILFTLLGLAGTADATPLKSLFRSIDPVVNSSFISPLVELFGDVSVGKQAFISANTIVRADPDTRICIGNQTNLQDNILFLALRDLPAPPADCGKTASSAGDRTSIAHQAIVKNSRIGDFALVGFHADLDNVILEDGAVVLHGARLENVRIGHDRLVPIGAVITTQNQADRLSLKTASIAQFQQDVLDVNQEFAEDYAKLYVEKGFGAVTGISAAPTTSWNAQPLRPTLGKNVRLDQFVRIVGDVRIGADSTIGQRTSIRADEGSPIAIGNHAAIEDRVTFHALKNTQIRIGKNLKARDNVVFHGALQAGDDLTVGDDAILFRSIIGDRVTIGTAAIVVGVTLPDHAQVPDRAVITTQADANGLAIGN